MNPPDLLDRPDDADAAGPDGGEKDPPPQWPTAPVEPVKPDPRPPGAGIYLILWLAGVLGCGFMNVGPFILPLALAWGVCLGLIYLAFFLSRRLEVWWREIITSYIIALCIAPGMVGNEGGAMPFPASLILIDGLGHGKFDWAFGLAFWSVHIVFFLIWGARALWRCL